ncbi:DUF2180 family protein [Streptomyces sp. RS10V-4]|uniref:DUF2180 family protein n=1 Tax=Streptomyces rhizoryzae TaxID=2932493 RepID=UPI002004B6A1|nr:DUF2180 family protein [Streptomyces rhizoryzae]MCK7622385.1 DUF2180 family protein [Streptomyces rhizoryzae]
MGEGLWWAAAAVYGVLAASEAVRPRPRYGVRRWATAFPLAMLTLSGLTLPLPSAVHTAMHVLVWVSPAVWLLAAAGAVRLSFAGGGPRAGQAPAVTGRGATAGAGRRDGGTAGRRDGGTMAAGGLRRKRVSGMKCFDCARADEAVDAVGICHHCGVGVCLRHCHVGLEPGHRLSGVGQSTLARPARVLVCLTCHSALVPSYAAEARGHAR